MAAETPELFVDLELLFQQDSEDSHTNIELSIALCIESQWWKQIDEACTMTTSELNCSQWFDWADILDTHVEHDKIEFRHQSMARKLIRSIFLQTDRVKLKDSKGSIHERDCCAPLLYCMLGRLSVDQIAGMAYLSNLELDSMHRLKRAFSEVYYMLMSSWDDKAERNIDQIKAKWVPEAFSKAASFKSTYMPISHMSELRSKNHVVNVSLVVNDDRIQVIFDVMDSKEPGTKSYGCVQSLKLLDAISLACAPEKINNTYFRPSYAFLQKWNFAGGKKDNPPDHTCFCPMPNHSPPTTDLRDLHQEKIDYDACKIVDDVYESWYISRHSAETIRCAMLGLSPKRASWLTDNSLRKCQAEDDAFLQCVIKNEGKSLMHSVIPCSIKEGPLGEMLDVLTYQDRVYLIYNVMVEKHLVDGRFCS